MKYNININQKALSENASLDISDGAIIDWLNIICGSVNKKVSTKRIDGWTWVDYGQLLRDMPLLRIKSKGALTPRFKKIRDAGYFEMKIIEGKLYVRATEKLDSLFIETVHEIERPRSRDRTTPFTKLNDPVHLNEPIIILDSNTKSVSKSSPPAEAKPWIFEEKLKDMEKNEGSYLDIIASFIREKGIVCENSKQLSNIITRWCKTAKLIEGAYTAKQVFDAIDYCKREAHKTEYDWGLQTVLKKLTNK